ncbi:hypothetical protein FRC07_001600, partial [Ceratobasidium sp. 392]
MYLEWVPTYHAVRRIEPQETFTGNIPYPEKNEIAVITAVVSLKELPERPLEHIPDGRKHGDLLWRLLTQCWAYEPADRPSAEEVKSAISNIASETLMPETTGIMDVTMNLQDVPSPIYN